MVTGEKGHANVKFRNRRDGIRVLQKSWGQEMRMYRLSISADFSATCTLGKDCPLPPSPGPVFQDFHLYGTLR